MNILELYKKEKRDYLKIREWLLTQGYTGDIVNQAIIEFAQRIADGEQFGYTSGGISVLSLKIRERVQYLKNFPDELKDIEIKSKKIISLWQRIKGLLKWQ